MSGEYKYDFDLRQPLEGLRLSDTSVAHAAESSQKRSGLGQQFGRRLRGPAATFAMICFSEVRQFEIDRKCFRHLVRFSYIQTTDNTLRTLDQALHAVNVVFWLGMRL